MVKFADMFTYLRKRKGLTQAELAAALNISQSTVTMYERGKRKPTLEDAEAIADYFNVDMNTLVGGQLEDSKPIISNDVVRLPVIAEVAAGFKDNTAMEDWEGDSIEIPRSYLKGHPIEDFFMLRVKGDSMYPLYMAGDIVLVLRQATLNRSGDIGVIRYNEEEATLKKVEFVYGENWMRLVAINPNYPPMLIENEDLEQCSVLGIPRMVIREIKD